MLYAVRVRKTGRDMCMEWDENFKDCEMPHGILVNGSPSQEGWKTPEYGEAKELLLYGFLMSPMTYHVDVSDEDLDHIEIIGYLVRR